LKTFPNLKDSVKSHRRARGQNTRTISVEPWDFVVSILDREEWNLKSGLYSVLLGKLRGFWPSGGSECLLGEHLEENKTSSKEEVLRRTQTEKDD